MSLKTSTHFPGWAKRVRCSILCEHKVRRCRDPTNFYNRKPWLLQIHAETTRNRVGHFSSTSCYIPCGSSCDLEHVAGPRGCVGAKFGRLQLQQFFATANWHHYFSCFHRNWRLRSGFSGSACTNVTREIVKVAKRNSDLSHARVAFPLNVRHLVCDDFNFERAKVPDAGFPCLERDLVMARR